MIKLFNKVSLILIMSTISFSAFSQTENFKLGKLQGKSWAMQGLTNKTNEDYYENNRITTYFNGKYFCTVSIRRPTGLQGSDAELSCRV